MLENLRFIVDMTATELRNVPRRSSWDDDIGLVDGLVILPTRRKSESGYRCIDIVATRGGKPVCTIGGSVDSIWYSGLNNLLGPPECGIGMEALPVSGHIHIFCREQKRFKVGADLSTMFMMVGVEK